MKMAMAKYPLCREELIILVLLDCQVPKVCLSVSFFTLHEPFCKRVCQSLLGLFCSDAKALYRTVKQTTRQQVLCTHGN